MFSALCQLASQGIVIASTNNACVDGLNFLKGVNQAEFNDFSSSYGAPVTRCIATASGSN